MLGALAVGTLVFAVASLGNDDIVEAGQPVSRVATVREFLRTALITRDAEGACEFLTPAERARVGGAGGCDEALARLAGRLRPPVYPVHLRGDDVLVLGRGAPVTLHLQPLPRPSRPAAVAPASGWRIASGVEDLPR
jgi:hypothetical protein